MMRACLYCGASVAYDGPSVFVLRISEPGGSAVYLRWCMLCADADPLHLALAEADTFEDDSQYAKAYLAIQQRTAMLGADALRARIDVRREPRDPTLTLRGHGLSWGRLETRQPGQRHS